MRWRHINQSSATDDVLIKVAQSKDALNPPLWDLSGAIYLPAVLIGPGKMNVICSITIGPGTPVLSGYQERPFVLHRNIQVTNALYPEKQIQNTIEIGMEHFWQEDPLNYEVFCMILDLDIQY